MSLISILIDLALIAILALCAWRGYKSGIVVSILFTAALIVALIAGNVAARVYSGTFENALATFASGIIDSKVDETVAFKGYDENGQPTDEYEVLSEEEKHDVYLVSFQTLRRVGLAEAPADEIALQTEEEYQTVNQAARTYLTQRLCARVSFAAVFFVVSILVGIIFAAIANIINLKFTIPGAEKVDGFVGLAINLFNGVMIVLFIASIFRYSGIIIGKHSVESTILASKLINHNVIANIFGF